MPGENGLTSPDNLSVYVRQFKKVIFGLPVVSKPRIFAQRQQLTDLTDYEFENMNDMILNNLDFVESSLFCGC